MKKSNWGVRGEEDRVGDRVGDRAGGHTAERCDRCVNWSNKYALSVELTHRIC